MSKHGMTAGKASQVKRGGHLREQIFSNQFSDMSMITINKGVNYASSTADCLINRSEFNYILEHLKANNGSTSIKGGSTYQFHLGRIPELIDYNTLEIKHLPSQTNSNKLETCFSSKIGFTEQLKVLSSYDFWKKYLGKGEILAIDAENHWNFFLMKDVLNLLINPSKIHWRIRNTGRIKGDLFFQDGSKRAGITFEHRFEKNQSVIGAHCGTTGISVFYPWLLENITNRLSVQKMKV